MDPFEARLQFSRMLSGLQPVTQALIKCSSFALRNYEYQDDFHSCILEVLEMSDLNLRLNIMNFIDTLLTQSKQSFSKNSNLSKSLPYVENIQRDLPLIVAKVVPANKFGLYNLRMCADLVRNVSLQLLLLGYDGNLDISMGLDSNNNGKENKNANETNGTKERNKNRTNKGNDATLDKNEEAALKVAKFEQEFKKTNLLEDQYKLEIERKMKNKKQKVNVLKSAETNINDGDNDNNDDDSDAEFQPIEVDKVGTGVAGAWKILIDRKKMSQYITYKSQVVEDKINGNGCFNTNGDTNDDDENGIKNHKEGEREDANELKHKKEPGNGKTTASMTTTTTMPVSGSASVPTWKNLELSREQILARMEADRERHKKAKESLWMIERQTTEKVDKAEFQKLWDRCGPLTNDDLRELGELSEVASKSYNF